MSWLKELEGLRGLASLWVFALHVSILSGAHILIISQGDLGVDLFILLSGFLMVHNYEQRKLTQPWSDPKTIRTFWLRRFFRIAPLYYLLLFVSLVMQPLLNWSRLTIGSYFPWTATDQLRYIDHSLVNIVMHLSFVFGFFPGYAFHTPLPDWSIGLEMQFYLVFPFLMLIVLRFGYIAMVSFTVAACLVAYVFSHAFFHSFPMPAFLPLRISLFLLGMAIAAGYHQKVKWPALFAILLPLYEVATRTESKLYAIIDVFLGIGLTLIVMDYPRLRGIVVHARNFLNLTICQKLGDVSYSVYLVHLLFVLPICATILRIPGVLTMPGLLRFALCFVANTLIVFPVSLLLYHYVEKPGIVLGKSLLASRQKIPVTAP